MYAKAFLLLMSAIVGRAFWVPSYGQDIGPPSLAIGAGKVLFDRGQLDAELIARLIATKQDEVKCELASRLILEKLQGESFVVWNFARKNINLLFREHNAKVIRKELLQNATELMVTEALLEFYLQSHVKRDRGAGRIPFTREIRDVILAFYAARTVDDMGGKKQVQEKFGVRSFVDDKYIPLYQVDSVLTNLQGKSWASIQRTSDTDRMSKPTIIFNLGKSALTVDLDGQKKCIYLHNLLLDLCFNIIQENKFIQELGLFYHQDHLRVRDHIDNYTALKRYASIAGADQRLTNLVEKLQVLDTSMRKDFDFLVKYSYVLSRLTKAEIDNPTPYTILSQPAINRAMEARVRSISELVDRLDYSQSVCATCDRSVFVELKQLQKANLHLDTLKDDDWYYQLEEVILPRLTLANLSNAGEQRELVEQFDELRSLLKQRLVKSLLHSHAGLTNRNVDILHNLHVIQSTFLRLIDILNSLDRAESYDMIMKFISDLGDLSPDPSVRTIANALTNGGARYLTIDEEKNQADLDVESMFEDLYNRFGENQSRIASLYFSVGLNYNVPFNDLRMDDNTVIRSFVLLSEKIGVKVKVRDWARIYMYTQNDKASPTDIIRQSRKPIVNDLHLLVFGSGLLYQINELTTAKDFKSPLAGLGAGLSFMNNMDINLNYSFPADKNVFDNGILNISFDIKITEYLSQLRKEQRFKKLEESKSSN